MQPHLGLFLTCLYKNQMARKEKEPFPENEEEDEVIAVAAFVVTTASDGGGMSVRPWPESF